MQRPHRRLDSKQFGLHGPILSTLDDTPCVHPSPFNNDCEEDEEAAVKRKSMSQVKAVAVTSRLSATLLGCCVLLLFFIKFFILTSNTSIPASLADLISEGHQVGVEAEFTPCQCTTLFYTSQTIDMRHCKSSVVYTRSADRGATGLVTAGGDVSVIIYAGDSRHHHPGFKNFKVSLDITGFTDIHVIEPPPTTREIIKYTHANYSGEADFWKERLQYFHHKTLDFPADRVLLFCDAFDTLFTQPPSTLLKRFRLFDSDIVFSTEMLCDTVSCRRDLWLKDFFTSVAPPANPYKYINAGMFIGTAAALRQFMQCALGYANNGRDDQTAFAHCFHQFYVNRNDSTERGKVSRCSLFFPHATETCCSASVLTPLPTTASPSCEQVRSLAP